MKLRYIQLFILINITLCFSACNSTEAHSADETAQNETNDEDLTHTDSALANPMDNADAFPEQMLKMEMFLTDFSSLEIKPHIYFEGFYAYSASQYFFYYDRNELAGIYYDHGEEGGGGGELRIMFQNINGKKQQTILYIPYQTDYEKGYFSYFENEKEYYYEILRDNQFYKPYISGPGELNEFDYQTDLDSCIRIIHEKRDFFTLKDKEGIYTYEIMRRLEESDYGETEEYEVIDVDSSLFNNI